MSEIRKLTILSNVYKQSTVKVIDWGKRAGDKVGDREELEDQEDMERGRRRYGER